MLKIGEFSTLAHCSVKTLRYYDELGLLKPVHIAQDSGYRYYSASQLPRLHRLLALKDLGFPLDQVAKALDDGIRAEELRGMLLLRRAEQEQQLRDEAERLSRLNGLLKLIEQEDLRACDVVLKEVEAQRIASVRDVIPTRRDIGVLFGRLYGSILSTTSAASLGTAIAIWHDLEHKEEGLDAEAGVYLNVAIPVQDPVVIRELPHVTAASIVHHGPFSEISGAYASLLQWIETNEYRQTAPVRGLFLHISMPPSRDNPSSVTEIQVPVEKQQ